MPIYEYEWQACGHKKEALQKISDDLLTECPWWLIFPVFLTV